MGCGCGKSKKTRQSSRMTTSEGVVPQPPKQIKELTPDQRRSKMVKMNNARKKAAQTKFQKKQESNQRMWERYRK
jgi:hypothetical protein